MSSGSTDHIALALEWSHPENTWGSLFLILVSALLPFLHLWDIYSLNKYTCSLIHTAKSDFQRTRNHSPPGRSRGEHCFLSEHCQSNCWWVQFNGWVRCDSSYHFQQALILLMQTAMMKVFNSASFYKIADHSRSLEIFQICSRSRYQVISDSHLRIFFNKTPKAQQKFF